MAYLVAPDGQLIYLSGLHTIGRLPQGIDTVINKPEISRYHAAIEWKNDVWWIKDLSLNGTWVNGEKITKNTPCQLNLNARIQFGNLQNGAFVVSDISPPQDILLRDDSNGNSSNINSSKAHQVSDLNNTKKIIHLNAYHLLPDEQHPEVAIYCKSGRWVLEELNSNEAVAHLLQHKDTVCISQQQWQVHLIDEHAATLPLHNEQDITDIILVFKLSLDEETTHMSVQTPESAHNLFVRSHHYMTLVLARQLIEDIRLHTDKTEQGWIYSEVLAKRLGIEESHLNIQIHRARKQFSELFSHQGNAEQLIQRRSGQVRLNCQHVRIYKGDNLESSSMEYLTENASTA